MGFEDADSKMLKFMIPLTLFPLTAPHSEHLNRETQVKKRFHPTPLPPHPGCREHIGICRLNGSTTV